MFKTRVNQPQDLKQNLRRQLKPYLEMLMHRKLQSTEIEWMGLVKMTEEHILNNPDQYLIEPPKKDVLDSVVRELFLEFVEEHHYRGLM